MTAHGGPATRIPRWLSDLETDDPEQRKRALAAIGACIQCDGSMFEPAPYVVPFLIDALRSVTLVEQVSIVQILGGLATATTNTDETMLIAPMAAPHQWRAERRYARQLVWLGECRRAVWGAVPFLLKSVDEDLDQDLTGAALGALSGILTAARRYAPSGTDVDAVQKIVNERLRALSHRIPPVYFTSLLADMRGDDIDELVAAHVERLAKSGITPERLVIELRRLGRYPAVIDALRLLRKHTSLRPEWVSTVLFEMDAYDEADVDACIAAIVRSPREASPMIILLSNRCLRDDLFARALPQLIETVRSAGTQWYHVLRRVIPKPIPPGSRVIPSADARDLLRAILDCDAIWKSVPGSRGQWSYLSAVGLPENREELGAWLDEAGISATEDDPPALKNESASRPRKPALKKETRADRACSALQRGDAILEVGLPSRVGRFLTRFERGTLVSVALPGETVKQLGEAFTGTVQRLAVALFQSPLVVWKAPRDPEDCLELSVFAAEELQSRAWVPAAKAGSSPLVHSFSNAVSGVALAARDARGAKRVARQPDGREIVELLEGLARGSSASAMLVCVHRTTPQSARSLYVRSTGDVWTEESSNRVVDHAPIDRVTFARLCRALLDAGFEERDARPANHVCPQVEFKVTLPAGLGRGFQLPNAELHENPSVMDVLSAFDALAKA